jgi:hypothetical protein
MYLYSRYLIINLGAIVNMVIFCPNPLITHFIHFRMERLCTKQLHQFLSLNWTVLKWALVRCWRLVSPQHWPLLEPHRSQVRALWRCSSFSPQLVFRLVFFSIIRRNRFNR